MAYNAYAQYTAYFSDEAEYNFASSFISTPGGSLAICPVDAAAMFDMPFPQPAGPMGTKGLSFLPPYMPNSNIAHPGPSGVILDPAILSFFVLGQTLPGFARGDDMNLTWALHIVRRGPEYTGADPTLIAPIPPRRWVIGFEAFGAQESQTGTPGTVGMNARNASRVVDGFGLKHRDRATGANTCNASLLLSEGTGVPSTSSWERFYVRFRRSGISTGFLWQCNGASLTLSGSRLFLNIDGTISVQNINNSGTVDVTFGTIPTLLPDTWYRFDLLAKYATGVGLAGSLRVYINGVLAVSGSVVNIGMGTVQNHGTSSICGGFAASNGWEIDFDDWHNAEIPNILGVEVLNSIDWLIGTHSKAIYSFSGSFTGWTGIPYIINQFKNPAGSAISLISTTAGAVAAAITNAIDYGEAELQDATGIIVGPASVSIGIHGSQNGGAVNDGQLGYSAAGGGTVLSTRVLSAGASSATKSYFPSGSITPYPIEPLFANYVKGGTANQSSIFSLTAYVQYIGIWGPEDGPEGQDPGVVFNQLIHNCIYPEIGYTVMGPSPDAPVCVIGGTYVGNSTSQSFSLPLPCHLLIIRNTASSASPMIINTTMFGSQQCSLSADLDADIHMQVDPVTGACTFTVAGVSSRINFSANTYQFFGFCDPGLRYVVNGEFAHDNIATTMVNPLVDGGYTPEFAIALQGPTNGGIWFKGPAHGSMEASTMGGTLVSNALGFSLGTLFSGDDVSVGGNATAYSLFRTIDGSNVVMVQVTSYIGNGLASRVIPLTPISTRFPLIAIVVRRGTTAAHYRDTSHAGANSCQMSNGNNTTTGIIAGGVDSITVGTTLNVTAALYDVLVIPGSGSGWLNGIFCGPNGVPPGDFWEPDPEPLPPGVAIMVEGGLIIGDANPLTILKNISGIYTLVPGKKNDTMYDRQTGQSSIDMEIPDPTIKTGYVGG